MKLNVFIDESGIHKITGHSSFVVVYVFITDQEKIDKEIQDIEKNLRIKNFHWADYSSKHKWNIRKEFIKNSLKLPFYFKYTIVNNPINPEIELHKSLVGMLTEKNIQNIYIDGKHPKAYGQFLKNLLRSKGLSVKNLKTVNDISTPSIRLADALAGLIRSHYDNPTNDTKLLYLKIINYKTHKPPF